MVRRTLLIACLAMLTVTAAAQRQRFPREAFNTDTPMVHDPVMAKDGDTYYIFSTGMGIQQMTSRDRTTEKLGTVPVIHFYK